MDEHKLVFGMISHSVSHFKINKKRSLLPVAKHILQWVALAITTNAQGKLLSFYTYLTEHKKSPNFVVLGNSAHLYVLIDATKICKKSFHLQINF